MHKLHIVSAFTFQGAGGNLAGVVLDADYLSATEKQQIASEAGLSETAFVSGSDRAQFKLEFFTPTKQIPNCGHATVAAMHLLQQHGRVGDGTVSIETTQGFGEVIVQGDQVFLALQTLCTTHLTDAQQRAALNAMGWDFKGGAPHIAGEQWPTADFGTPVIISAGNPFVLIEYSDAEALSAIKPDMTAIAALSETWDVVGFYPYAIEYRGGKIVGAEARMFAPHYGIPEEAATGMAAGALAGYLREAFGNASELCIRQGHLMPNPSPSAIRVVPKTKGWWKPREYMVGGTAKLVGEKVISTPTQSRPFQLGTGMIALRHE